MAILGAILFPVISTFALIVYSFIWAGRATKNIFENKPIYLYFFVIFVGPLLWLYLFIGVVLYIVIIEAGAYWWTAYGGICKYSSLPGSDEHENN